MAQTPWHNQIGRNGEIIAGRFLEDKGLEILHRNMHCKDGEIDIIAWNKKHKEYVFVEVKTRTEPVYGDMYDTLSYGKFKRFMNGIQEFLFTKNGYHKNVPEFRVDIVFVKLDKDQQPTIEHIENFAWDEF